MTEKLPRVTPSDDIRAVEKSGFEFSRQSGSHKIYKNAAGRRITIPYHVGKTLHPKVLQSILSDMGLTVEEFRRILK